MPDFEKLNNNEKLSIMSFVSSFSKDHFSKKISYQILLTKIRFI